MSSFFDDKKRLIPSDLHDFEFEKMNGLSKELRKGFLYEVAPDGGCVMVSKNYAATEQFMVYETELRENIVVYNSAGETLNYIRLKPTLIHAGILSDERILVVLSDATYGIYNPYEKNLQPQFSEIPLNAYFNKEKEGKGIEFVKIVGDTFVIMEANKTLHIIYNLDSPKRLTLNYDREVETMGREQLFGLYDYRKSAFCFYAASLKKGVCSFDVKSMGKKEDLDNVPSSKRRFFEQVTRKIISVSASLKNKTLAALTDDFKLYVVDVTNQNNLKTFDVKVSDIEKRRFSGLEWIKNSVVVACFAKSLRFYAKGYEEELEVQFNFETNSDRSPYFLVRTEVDGLRVIAVNEKGAAQNFLVRKAKKAYANVRSTFRETPGFQLYQNYKSHIKNSPPEQYIFENKQIVKDGVGEVLKAAVFELNPKKQMKLIKAARYGKIFLEEDYPDKDCIANICKFAKIITNLRNLAKRAISNKQFISMSKDDASRLIRIFQNSKNFQFAFFFISNIYSGKDKTLISNVFRNWAIALMDSPLKESEIGIRLVETFSVLSEMNKNIPSTVLIDIASSALGKNKTAVVHTILQKDNPPLLKITLYMKMGEYAHALWEAMSAHDSNIIYMVINKIIDIVDEKSKEKDIEKLIADSGTLQDLLKKYLTSRQDGSVSRQQSEVLKESSAANYSMMLQDHFYKLCVVKDKSLESHLEHIKDPKKFLIYSLAYLPEYFSQKPSEIIDEFQKILETRKKFEGQNQGLFNLIKLVISQCNFCEFDPKSLQLSSGSGTITPQDVLSQISVTRELTRLINENYTKYLDPSSGVDGALAEKVVKLKVSDRRVFIARLRFMLEKTPSNQFDKIIRFIERNKAIASIVQIYHLLVERSLVNRLNDALSIFDFATAFEFCTSRNLFFNAAFVAAKHRKKDHYDEAFGYISKESEKAELRALENNPFK